MKRVRCILHTLFLLAVLPPCTAMAQGTDPPPTCCRKNSIANDATAVASQGFWPTSSSSVGTEVYLSDETIFRLGLTRREMVDRLAAAFYAGRIVDLLIPKSTLQEPMSDYPSRGGRGLIQTQVPDGMLVAVEVRRFYQVRKSMVRDEDLDSAKQLFITDGETYVTVNLIPRESVAESQ